MMRRIFFAFCISVALFTVTAVPVFADCKDEIKEVRDDLDKNKDTYDREAVAQARKHLVQAEVPSLKPADCRREVAEAKKALRQGKK